MRRPAEWMQMPTDDRILECLDTGLRLTPAVIGENIDRSREQVSRRLKELTEQGLTIRPKRGYYEITDSGRAYLAGDLDPDEIEQFDDN